MNQQGVVCAIDVHDFDQQVVDLAATFAKQFGVDLDLVYVTISPDPDLSAWPAYFGVSNELTPDSKLLKQVRTKVEGVEVLAHHLFGLPVKQVVDFVMRKKPQLLVLGTHARRGISRVMGSYANKIMRQVNCPVMLLRQGRPVEVQ